MQSSPPCCGSGLVHIRPLDLLPWPQVLLQSVQSNHELNPPLIGQGSEPVNKISKRVILHRKIQN